MPLENPCDELVWPIPKFYVCQVRDVWIEVFTKEKDNKTALLQPQVHCMSRLCGDADGHQVLGDFPDNSLNSREPGALRSANRLPLDSRMIGK